MEGILGPKGSPGSPGHPGPPGDQVSFLLNLFYNSLNVITVLSSGVFLRQMHQCIDRSWSSTDTY